MVIQEQSGSDVEGDEDVNGIVFMCGQDEKDAKEVKDPGQGVNKIPTPWSIFVRQLQKNRN